MSISGKLISPGLTPTVSDTSILRCFLRTPRKGDIEERNILALQLQVFFAKREVAISEGQELLFIEKQIPLVISRPFKFPGHG